MDVRISLNDYMMSVGDFFRELKTGRFFDTEIKNRRHTTTFEKSYTTFEKNRNTTFRKNHTTFVETVLRLSAENPFGF